MIKIAQFGEGGFLRTFVDYYFENLNDNGGDYSVSIIKPITFGNFDRFIAQNNKYNVVLRGVVDGKAKETVKLITCVKETIDPFNDINAYYNLAEDKDLKIIVSNTTEAGICFNENDKFDDFENITYPAKLTKFLLHRFNKGLEGVYLMPVELIDENGAMLKKCVDKYVELWNLPEDFKKWNATQNFYLSTLVDRIVSGYPKTQEDIAHIDELIGYKDNLVSIGEPFGLWVIENKGEISKYIKDGFNGINVILAEDITYYKKRKVRVLNGSHTNIVCAGLFEGADTVYDCMLNINLRTFLDDTLKTDIIPFVSSDVNKTTEFANEVIDRFLNPYLNHKLISISLNSISKWKARVLPSFKDYYSLHGEIAKKLTIGFSYLMKIYSSLTLDNGLYYADTKNGKIEIKDDKPYLDYFANGGSVKGFMQNANIWGEDLTLYKNFYETVEKNLEILTSGGTLL